MAERAIPTCRPSERVGEVRRRLGAEEQEACVVVNDERIVLGVLAEDAWRTAPDSAAEDKMQHGPSTFRPNVPAEEMAAYMREHGLERALVTTADGELIGAVNRREVEHAAHAGHAREAARRS